VPKQKGVVIKKKWGPPTSRKIKKREENGKKRPYASPRPLYERTNRSILKGKQTLKEKEFLALGHLGGVDHWGRSSEQKVPTWPKAAEAPANIRFCGGKVASDKGGEQSQATLGKKQEDCASARRERSHIKNKCLKKDNQGDRMFKNGAQTKGNHGSMA